MFEKFQNRKLNSKTEEILVMEFLIFNRILRAFTFVMCWKIFFVCGMAFSVLFQNLFLKED